MKISYSFGVIDLLHYGHINALKKAKEGSDLHIFGLISDSAAKSWLGNTVCDYEERLVVLKQLKCVDEVVYQDSYNPLNNLIAIHDKYPHAKITIFHGNDIRIKPAQDFIKRINGEVILTDYYEKLSPDKILEQLKNKDVNIGKHTNIISTKANTLLSLKPYLKKSAIEDLVIINIGDYLADKKLSIEKIQNYFRNTKIVIRSSSSNEDCFNKSNAGHYESVLNVNTENSIEIENGLERVIDSYREDILNLDNEQILVQKQTNNVKLSGVIFTRDVNFNRPYYTINYDENGSTDAVTSGKCSKTKWIYKNIELNILEEDWRRIIESVKEIEELLLGLILDIEFAITHDHQVIIFQVRPLAAGYKFNRSQNDHDFYALKDSLLEQYENYKVNFNVETLSDMAFWNPSEIIGSNPHNLDFSLYREIITNSAWNQGLIPLGYSEVNSDLMYKLGNKPYISLNQTFLSLIPSSFPAHLKRKLLKYYNQKLIEDPSCHDKVEFEIIFSCFDFNLKSRLDDLSNYGFSDNEKDFIYYAITDFTKDIIINYPAVLKNDTNDISKLIVNLNKIKKSYLVDKEIKDIIYDISLLVKDIKELGTPQFSRQARCAFISKVLCFTLSANNVITKKDVDTFLESINTVASEFEKDFNLYSSGDLDRDKFNEKYGHLRAGTYDIRSLNYKNINFTCNNNTAKKSESKKYSFDKEKILTILDNFQLCIKYEELDYFLRNSIEQREFFKFEFTKSLSFILELIELIGSKLGIEKNELSYLEIKDFLYYNYDYEFELRNYFLELIQLRKIKYNAYSNILLPDLIKESKDIEIVSLVDSRPNFITEAVIKTDVILLEGKVIENLEGKIVAISNADPGFDWIFTQKIAGLVTEYGGVASHMAIRCAEFNIPAAIGCGKRIFSNILNSNKITLDCYHKNIECE